MRAMLLAFLAGVLAVPANAASPVQAWPDGWQVFGIAIRGDEMAAFGYLTSPIRAANGKIYFDYHSVLYGVDPERRSFRRDRELPRACRAPVIDERDAVWCIDRDTIVRVDRRGARRAYASPIGTPSSLAVDGNTVAFTAPPHAVYAELVQGRFSIHHVSTVPAVIAAAPGQRCLGSPNAFVSVRRGALSTWHVAVSRGRGVTAVAALSGRCYAVLDDARGSHVLVDSSGRRRKFDLSLNAANDIAIGRRGIAWLVETKLGPPSPPQYPSYTVEVRLVSVFQDGVREMRLPILGTDAVGGPALDRAGRIWLSIGRLHAFSVLLPPPGAWGD